MSNIFLVTDGRLTTPSVQTSGIAGIMRRKVLETAADIGLEYRESPVSRPELLAADEIFLSNSQFVIWPVREVGEHRPGPGPLTRQIMAALASQGISEWPA